MFYACSVDVLFPGANVKLFRGGGPYHIETSPLICSANQWSGFYMIGTSVMKELRITLIYEANFSLSTWLQSVSEVYS